jgi:CubicO group peptidase (beta-lactamase class C family)
MQVADGGRLDPGDPVARHLPWFHVPGEEPITLEHLLRHRSGITAGIDGSPDAFGQVWALRDLVPSARPGEGFHYSNVGYKTLGLVLEAVDGRPYPEVIRRRILEPLGMTDTTASITNDDRARLAVGHAWADDRIGHPGSPLLAAPWLETDTADGSIASTAADMAIFVRLLLRRGGGIVSDAAWQRMVEPVPVDAGFGYGYALGTRVVGGRTFIGHTGGMVGYVAMLSVEPEAGLGSIVLMNGYGSPASLSRSLIAAARELRDGRDPRAADPEVEPTLGLDELAGRWRAVEGGLSFELRVAAEARLTMHPSDDETIEVESWDAEHHLARHPSWDRFLLRVDRGPDGDGDPELWHGGTRYAREGVTPRELPHPDPALRAPMGTYRSFTPWTPLFHVVLRGDRLWLLFPEAPDGADPEQPLIPLDDGSFRLGDDVGGPERVRFDLVLDGRSRRAYLSGWPYHRVAG